MELFISNRDPTENDAPHFTIWWNCEYNRFFMFKKTESDKVIWEYLKEKTEYDQS